MIFNSLVPGFSIPLFLGSGMDLANDEDVIASIIAKSTPTARHGMDLFKAKALDPQVVSEMKDVFSLFDFHHDGTIATEDLGACLRGLGKNLTEEEIGNFINENDHDGSGKLDFPCFYNIVAENQPMREASTIEEVEEYFEPFDMAQDGRIPAEDFVNMLLEMGEPLTQDDVNHLLREIDIDGDNTVDIRAFIQHMFMSSLDA